MILKIVWWTTKVPWAMAETPSSISCLDAKTLETNPKLFASVPPNLLPVMASSIAFPNPTILGNRCRVPRSATNPRSTSFTSKKVASVQYLDHTKQFLNLISTVKFIVFKVFSVSVRHVCVMWGFLHRGKWLRFCAICCASFEHGKGKFWADFPQWRGNWNLIKDVRAGLLSCTENEFHGKKKPCYTNAPL